LTFSTAKENSNINSNYRIRKETFAKVSHRMSSEIMSAFTEIAEKDPMKAKNSEKRALFSIKCSRGAQSSTRQRTGKHQEKELLPSMRRRKLK